MVFYSSEPCWLYSDTGEIWTTHPIKARYKDVWTGLLDKNGKEIYEGDILVSLDGRKSVIEYDAPHFIVRHKPENGSDFIAAKNHFEIIGNIHETLDLLTNT